MNRRRYLMVLLATLFLSVATPSLEPALAQGQPDGRQALPPKPRHRQLNSLLSRLADLSSRAPDEALTRARESGVLIEADRLAVSIRFNGSPGALLSSLEELGLTVRNVGDGVVEAYVPLESLERLDALPDLISVEPIRPPAALVVSQGVAVHNAQHWQANGFRGAGVRVGIIDVGFIGFAALMGAELPLSVVARCYTSIGAFSDNLANCQTGSDHGTAVAESLIDVSPQVQLYIANPKSPLDLQQTAQWMTAQGVRVINYSAAYRWDGPGNGSSPYSDSPLRTVDQAVAGGAVFVAAAGNEALATWFGPFVDANGNGWAEFAGVEDNHVQAAAGTLVVIQLRWSDSWSAASRDLDLGVFDGSTLVDASIEYQDGAPGGTPFEIVGFIAPRTAVYTIAVASLGRSVAPVAPAPGLHQPANAGSLWWRLQHRQPCRKRQQRSPGRWSDSLEHSHSYRALQQPRANPRWQGEARSCWRRSG